jgi:nicotinamidase/pyrazinamidase
MKSIFFLDVDTQRDFILPGGRLYVPGAERLIPKFRRLFDFARKNEITVLSTTDAHLPDDPEFERFPPHCVQGTEGQRKIDDTLLARPYILENKTIDRNLLEVVRKYRQIIVQKQTLDVFENPVVGKLLRTLPSRAIVFGVATEYCVKLAALGLRRFGVKAAVVSDAIRALAQKGGDEATEEMRGAGCEFITVDTLMGIEPN